MKRWLVLVATACWFFCALTLGAAAQGAPSDDELLVALDSARFLEADVNTIRVRIVSTTPDETREAELLLRFFDSGDTDAARIEFLAPPELAGQVYLSTPDATYFFVPDLEFPIKTSATAEVFGDSAVAQTSGIRFQGKYTVAARRTVSGADGESLLEVDLVAVDFTVAFQAITLRVDPVTLRPLFATLYALSGLPFYDVTYKSYVTRDSGDVYVSEQEIANRLFLGRVTTSEILEATAADLPASLFDPTLLGPSGG
jgi:hypothetical protein